MKTMALLAGMALLGFACGVGPALAAGAADARPAAQAGGAKMSEQETAEKYAARKAKMSPEERAWEALLEKELGAFYLPHYKRDKAAGRETSWDFVKDDPKLPRALLIGDSISRGYTLATRHALAGKVNLHRAPENCGPSMNGLVKLDVWLGKGAWDVIHFNFGIHDWNLEPADYENRMRILVERLEETGARLVWASSTPLPARYHDDDQADAKLAHLNDVAAGIMKKHGISIDDLYSFVKPRQKELQNPGDCHFPESSYILLGNQVAESILSALRSPRAAAASQKTRTADALVWQDNFDRAELGPGWHCSRGEAKIEDGRLLINGPAEVIFDPASCGLSFGRDLRVEYDAMSKEPGDLSLLLGVPNSRDVKRGTSTTRTGYLFAFASRFNKVNSLMAFDQVMAKSEQPLAQPGKWHHVVAEKRGDQLRLTVDGKEAASARLPRLWGGGGVGFYVWTGGEFDNLKLYAVPANVTK